MITINRASKCFITAYMIFVTFMLLNLDLIVPNKPDVRAPIHDHVARESQKVKFISDDVGSLSFFDEWHSDVQTFCQGQVRTHGRRSVHLNEALLVPERAVTSREEDSDEFYTFHAGFFKINCQNESSNPVLSMSTYNENFLEWSFALDYDDSFPISSQRSVSRIPEFTIALTRYEYANVYWVVAEVYDAFLTAQFYGVSPSHANILFLDAHPPTALDDLWTKTFKRIYKLSDLDQATVFNELVWNFPRHFSPFLLTQQLPYPLLKEFRQYVLSSVGVEQAENTESILRAKCDTDRLKVTFIWRRDYIAHARNPSGLVSRKITNEDQLIEFAKDAYPTYDINGVQLDTLSINEQLLLVSQTDVFVGMHGAAFGFIVFMEPGRGVIEFWPYTHEHNWHMAALAQANGLHYQKWRNNVTENEDRLRLSTHLHPLVVNDFIGAAAKRICNLTTHEL